MAITKPAINTKNENPAIDGADTSASLVFERMGGTLPPDNPVALAAGIGSLSGMSGFDRKGFSWRHCLPDIWTLAALESGEGTVDCENREFPILPGSCSRLSNAVQCRPVARCVRLCAGWCRGPAGCVPGAMGVS